MPIYKSPSTSIRPIDVSSVERTSPVGVPAIIIGTSRRGRAFFPINVGTFDDFVAEFGNVGPARFGPLAMRYWMRSRSSGTYLRLLGIGDGKRRRQKGENAGSVNRAGFIVGSQQVQANGLLGHNAYAGIGGPPGKTYILGCFMSQTNGSTVFSEAGMHDLSDKTARPIIRGVLMAPSGVHLTLNTEVALNNTPSSISTHKHAAGQDGGLAFGDILLGEHGEKSNFIVLLNGFTPHGNYKNAITASFDPEAYSPEGSDLPKPIRQAFNTDPNKIEEAGHYLRIFHDISTNFAIPTGTNVTHHEDTNKVASVLSDGVNRKLYQTAFLLTSSLSRNSGSASSFASGTLGVPNLENFENRYTNSFSPVVVSQKIKGKNRNLFRFYAHDDGEAGSLNYKITIEGFDLAKEKGITPYPRFNVHVRSVDQSDESFFADDIDANGTLESFIGVNLDPSDPKFISKVIGDTHKFYDFDKKSSEGQKEVQDGLYEGRSRLIRVEVDEQVAEGKMPTRAFPMGFRGLYHLVTSGSGPILTGSTNAAAAGSLASLSGITQDNLGRIVQPPVPFRENIAIVDDLGAKKAVNNAFTWGVQFENKFSPTDTNKLGTFNTSSLSYMVYMPDFHTNYQNVWVGDNEGALDINGSVFDADRFNNNLFTMERIEVLTSSDNTPDKDQWQAAVYRRNGKLLKALTDSEGISRPSRFLKSEDFNDPPTTRFLSFTFPLMGGFDGANSFDYEKSNFTSLAVHRESIDRNQGGRKGPTFTSYLKALEVFENTNYEGSLLAMPGMKNDLINEEALMLCQNRGDLFYVMDIESRDEFNAIVTGTLGAAASIEDSRSRLSNTRKGFQQNPRNTSFGAAYFPDLIVNVDDLPISSGSGVGHRVPPTTVVLGLYAQNPDYKKIIGHTTGQFEDVIDTQIKFTDSQIDEYFQAGINLISGPSIEEGGGAAPPFAKSQHTLSSDLSPMSRISVRRMILYVKRRVRAIVRSYLFRQLDIDVYRQLRDELSASLAGLQALGAFKYFQIEISEDPREIEKDKQRNLIRAKVLIRPNDVSEHLIVDADEALGDPIEVL